MVFGVFDNFHPGHEYFLSEARKLCEELVVAITPPEVVLLLKKSLPKNSFEERANRVKEFNQSFVITSGDEHLGAWSIFEKFPIDIVILGYDQKGIALELDKKNIPYLYLESHYPEKYKSSLYKLN